MERMLLIDGNSILNRAFYGIMGNKMLTTQDGTYTNAVYGFLSILFKTMEELNPNYIVVAFDKKGPTKRHKMYKEYKANRKGMPEELAMQMPIIKEILQAMNVKIIEKDGYEGDDIIGTLSRFGEKNNLNVTILSGDRDNFQLTTDKITVQIPRTKQGKTQTDNFDRNKVLEEYGVEPYQLIQVKGLMGDSSDNIPGVPGIGEKTALELIKEYTDIDNLYEKIENGTDNIKGKLREKLIQNKDLAFLSRELGRINIDSPIEENLEEMKVEEWDRQKVLELFKKYRFNRYIERFKLLENEENINEFDYKNLFKINDNMQIKDFYKIVKDLQKIFFYFELKDNNDEDKIIKSDIVAISVYDYNKNEVYNIKKDEQEDEFKKALKDIFEDSKIEKYGYEINYAYIILKQMGITMENIKYDVTVAAYILNPTIEKYPIDNLTNQYLNINVSDFLNANQIKEQSQQITFFQDNNVETNISKYKSSFYAYSIYKLQEILTRELEKINAIKLFEEIDMPTVEVLSDMQWNGMYADKIELDKFGDELKQNIEIITKEIYELAGVEFNINSTKQLGEILFEKLKLPIIKKTKNGYSTDVDVLEKLKLEHPIIEKILEYRQLAKLNSTYVEGLKPYINSKTNRIHSFFHQTITATGRISSTEPNLQNIPTRIELGKRLRKVFKPAENKIYLDADYSQIELRVLAHISKDENMIQAFNNNEDIHKQAASKVFNIPMEEVTKQQRSNAKAVNFGIVYGISDFGLAEQLGISRKIAKQYIEQYLEKYSGIKEFMQNIIEQAKQQGYVETLFHRRRYIPELKSSSYMVRQFGGRAAMNTPIQGTAADIMKIAMINVYKKLKERNLKSKIVLQVHDEMMIEALIEEKDDVKKILKESMENAIKLDVPLIAEISEANNWYEAK